MNRREERWGRERDVDDWRREPGRYRGDDGDIERGAGAGRGGEYQGHESRLRSQSGSYRAEGEGGDYYGGREDYRGRGSESARGEWRPSGRFSSEEPYGMSFDEGRVQWRPRQPGEYGSERYGSGYEDRAGRGGYSRGGDSHGGWQQQGSGWRGRDDEAGYGGRYGERRSGSMSGQGVEAQGYGGYGGDRGAYGSSGGYGDEYGTGGYGSSGARLTRYGRHERGESGGRYAGIGPKGYRRSPERLKEQVCELLAENGELDASDIEVKVEEDGTVTLTGSVEDRRMKRLAEDLAGSVNGVSDVTNQIKVSSRSSAQETGSSIGGAGSESGRGRTGREGSSSSRENTSTTRSSGGTASKSGF